MGLETRGENKQKMAGEGWSLDEFLGGFSAGINKSSKNQILLIKDKKKKDRKTVLKTFC